jgi:iron complex transport system substrate-binding protein
VRRPAAIVLLVALVTVAAGCGFKTEPTGTLPVQFPVTISDAAGRSITLETPPQVIVAMDPAAERLLASVGAKATVVPATTGVAALKAQHPDLVVMSPQTTPARADVVARALGVPTYVLAGFALSSIERGAAALGLATGHGLAGRDLALKLRARREKIEQAIASSTPQSVFADQGFGYSIAPDELLATLVKDARGTLVGAAGTQPITQQHLEQLDPDVYLLEQSSNLTLKGLRKLKLTAGLRAVRSGRVLIVDDKTIEPDQDAYTLLEQIAHFLHPESLP